MNTSLTFYDFINNVIIGFLLIIACLPMDNISMNISWEFVIIPSYIIGLIYTKLNEFTLGCLLRNDPIIMEECYNKIHEEYKKRNITGNIYYGTYYKGWKRYCERNLEILEAQLAFIRNIWPILVVYSIGIITTCNINLSLTNGCYINLLPIICLFSFMCFSRCLYDIGKSKKINILKCDIVQYIFCGIIIDLCIIIGLCIINFCNNHYSPLRLHNIDIDTNFTLTTIEMFIIILPKIGYYIQKKIYKLVFEYDTYVQKEEE